ncbi:MAG: LysM peptidoglycan-binding domain-containing protein [Anaerolineae bacterium]
MTYRAVRLVIILMVVLTVLIGMGMPVQGAPAASGQVVHVVRWGETLEGIAARYGVSVWAIVQANGLANPDYIYVGQTLIIPAAGAPAPAGGTTYVVQWGDSLSSIAYRFGTTVEAIMGANGLSNPNFIYAGQVLNIPAAGTPPTPAPPPPAVTTRYVVRWGDTLSAIAYRFGTTVEAIMRANNLANSWYIYAGQVLLIPSGTALPPSMPAATYYVVQPGDTLARIALRYGTTVWALVQANNLPNPSLIYPGQVLVIPGQVYPPAPRPPTWPPAPTPTPVSTPGAPVVTRQWIGRITSSNCTDQDTWEFRSVLRVSVIGKKGLPVRVSTEGWQTVGLTGTKPEYGEYAVEFAPFNQGIYTVTPEGLGTSIQVRLDGRCTAYVEFAPVNVTTTNP